MKYIIATIIEVLMLIGMFVVYMDLNQDFFQKFKIKYLKQLFILSL